MKNLICIALKSELPDYHHEKASVIYTGVGKINATLALTTYLSAHTEVEKVINIGSAGGIYGSVKAGDLVECGMFKDGDLSYPGYLGESITNWQGYTLCATFDSFQTKKPACICHVVDMEAYALARVAKHFGNSFYCFKYITDVIGEPNQGKVWTVQHATIANTLRAKLSAFLG